MARKIRFPLKMTNDKEVRTIEELRADFDLTAVLGYYADGKLVTWLRDRYLDSEADKIAALDKDSKSFQSDLCAALGVESPSSSDEANGELDMDYINRRNEKKRILRTITDDEEIIYKVDQVALDQDDLFDIYDEGKKEIYLCQGEFEIPLSVTDVTYYGVANPIVTVRVTDNVNFKEKNIKFVDCVYGWDVSNTTPLDDVRKAENLFLKGDYKKAMEILEIHAENGNPRADIILRLIYDYYFSYNTAKTRINFERLSKNSEVCSVIHNIWDRNINAEKAEKYLTMLKKLCEKGDWLSDYHYARLLGEMERFSVQCNTEEMIKYYYSTAEKGNFSGMLRLIRLYTNYYDFSGVEKDEEKSQKMLLKYAEEGEALAQAELGYRYEWGRYGVEKNYEKAFEWTKKAATANIPHALYSFGEMYRFGKGVKKDVHQAIKLFEEAFELGMDFCANLIGNLYFKGEEVTQNYNEAFKWFSKPPISKKHHYEYSDDQYKLGECYYYGYGVLKDFRKAAECFRECIEDRGIFSTVTSSAKYMLGNIYYNGDGVKKDKAEAVNWYLKAVTDESTVQQEAYLKLIRCYYYGDGIEVDYKQAFMWIIRGNIMFDDAAEFVEIFNYIEAKAEAGDAESQKDLGLCYHWGIGVDYDDNKAEQWFLKSADNENAEAMYYLGSFYRYEEWDFDENDNLVTKINYEKSIKYLERSAAKGFTEAMKRLGMMYHDGDYGVSKNNAEALKWYNMAAEHGADVEYHIEEIKRELNEEVTL